MNPRVTIGIPTRDRPKSLRRLLASLHMQTYHDWDLFIINDSSGPMLDPVGEFFLERIGKSGHQVIIAEGPRINQAYCHNLVLWSNVANELILRMDDDICPQRDFLERLVQAWTTASPQTNLGAVGGIYFTEHLHSRYDNPPVPTSMHVPTDVAQDGTISPYAQMQEYEDDEPFKAEHLYSCYMYSRDAMRRVGGFPMVYSVGVSYHEESEATYKLHLAGYDLLVIPGAKAEHSHSEVGGTRLMSESQHRRQRELDWTRFLMRLPLLRGIDWKPSLCIYSDHWSGIGGAQRLTYQLSQSMLELGMFSEISLAWPEHEVPDGMAAVKRNFGIEWDESNFALPFNDLPVQDLVISIGHQPPDLDKIPPRKTHIHYSLYPIFGQGLPKGVDRYVAISEFSADGVRDLYRANAEVIYPYVEAQEFGALEKENLIVMVGRGIGKAMADLIQAFLGMDLPEDTKLCIITPKDESTQEFSRLRRLSKNPAIEWMSGISEQEKIEVLKRAKLLWAGRGLGSPQFPQHANREHFGYTPIEALHYYCLPLAFDDGGYRETTLVRWSDVDELESLTIRYLKDREEWNKSLVENRNALPQFGKDRFETIWHQVVTTSHSHAWEQEIQWRRAGQIDISTKSLEVHIACIGANPYLKTAYGIVAEQIYKGLVDDGMKVHVYGMGCITPDIENRYESLWPMHQSIDNKKEVMNFLADRQYDAALMIFDPFVSMRMLASVGAAPYRLPSVAFVSQEGLPPHMAWESILENSDVAITYCRTGAKVLSKRFGRPVDWTYLGVDHAPFEQFNETDAVALRSMMGWENKFVIMNVSRNVRTKRLACLVKALKILCTDSGYDYDDFILLLHTNMRPDQAYHGVDISMYSKLMEIPPGTIVISPTPKSGIVPYESDLETLLSQPVPLSVAKAMRWMKGVGMIARYNMANVYVDVASCEGFCMPIFEAMACGVPVVSVNDYYVRAEVCNFLSKRRDPIAELVEPVKNIVDEWITGADLVLVRPEDVAAAIDQTITLKRTTAVRAQRAAAMVNQLKWDVAREKVVEAVRKCLG